MHNKNYKHRLSLILLFVFLFAVTISAFSYFLSVTTRQKQTQEQLTLQKLSNYFDTVNQSMLSTFQSLTYLTQKDSLKDFAYAKSTWERSLASIDVQKDIQSAMLSPSYLPYCQIAVSYVEAPDKMTIITQDSSYSLNQYAQSVGMDPDGFSSLYKELESKPFGNAVAHSIKPGKKEYIHYAITLPNIDKALMIVLSIDKENFENAFSFPGFQDWFIFTDDKILFTKYDRSNTESAGDGEDTGYPYLMSLLNELEHDPSSSGIIKTGLTYQGNPLVYASFSEIGWQLGASYASKKVNFMDVFLLFLLPLLFLSLCILLPVRLISQYLYAPINQVVTQLGGTEEEADNEFEFISRKTHQISERVQELNKDLKHNERLLREQLIKSAFLGQNFSPDDIRSPEMRQSCYIASLVEKVDHDSESLETFPILKSALREITMSQSDVDYINTGSKSFALIISCREQTAAMDIAMDLFSKVNLLSCIQVQVALSDSVTGVQNLNKAYEQCCRLFEYRYLLNDHLFLTLSDLSQIYCDGYHYSMSMENLLIEKVLSGTDGALTLLDEILRKNLELSPLSPEDKQAFFLALCSTLNRIYQELHIAPGGDFIKVTDLLQNSSPEKAEVQIRSAFSRVVKRTREHQETITQNVSMKMMNYIYENYSQDISLDSIAASLNISPKYCSALFKKETGNTFKRFLNEYRITQAKKFLQQTPEMRIGTLAEQVGFTNANTFIQVFKQYTATTPHQYAEQFIKKQ